MASNTTFNPEIVDFDDYSDWIELYNESDSIFVSNNLFISDNANNPLKWKIPDGTIIQPNEYLVIWADGYNDIPGNIYTRPYWPWEDFITIYHHTNFKISSDGEELILTKAQDNMIQTLISTGAEWKYNDNGIELNGEWKSINYEDSYWNIGYAELGYGDGDETTIIDYGDDEDNKYITTYFRKLFFINSPDDFTSLLLKIKRDDGAVIYLNEQEIFRSNMPYGPISFSTQAESSISGDEEDAYIEFTSSTQFLESGQNILACEIHQRSQTSSDISFDLSLEGISYDDIQILDSVYFENQITDVSYGRTPDSLLWSFLSEPTPGSLNDTSTVQVFEFSSDVYSSLNDGFYNSAQTLILSNDDSIENIHYTIDGSRPNKNSLIYTEPIQIDSTMIIKARSLSTYKIPGNISSFTFFINEQVDLPVLSLVVEPNLLWDQDIGIYENEFKQREIPISLQYFSTNLERKFSINAGARLGGLNIWTKAQKPFTIYTRNRFGDDFINYQIFNNKHIANFSRIVLRNGGDDWEETLIRDPMTESIALGMMECGYMAYKPSVLFLNGEYWGIYNIREKFNNQYFKENFNIDPNNYDHLEYTMTESGTQLMIVEGDDLHYNSMIEYIDNNDINNEEAYNHIISLMNIDSFIDHIFTTLYAANTSWRHNREWWRSRNNNGKWNWLIVDLDRGFNPNNSSTNLLDDLMEDYTLFNSLLNSTNFKNRFIQRSAAHLNNTFKSQRIDNIVDSLSNIIRPEIIRHSNKWSNQDGIESIEQWESELNEIKQFSENRTNSVQNQFINELNLNGTINLSFSVYPENSGQVTINNVKSVNNNNQKYFKDIPIVVNTTANPGYEFIGWSNGTESNILVYNCELDSGFTAIFSISEDIILPNIINENLTLNNNQNYLISTNLFIENGASLIINEGVEIQIEESVNIIVNGQLFINGTESNPVKIKSFNDEIGTRWGGISFNNNNDTSFISHLDISQASAGFNPIDDIGAFSIINSNLIVDHLTMYNVQFPIYVNGGSLKVDNSSITTESICDFINVKNGDANIKNSLFYGRNAPDTDAIDLDNVSDGIVENNRIYNFSGFNSDGIDIGERSQNIIIKSNKMYHINDKGISVGQNSTVNIENNLFVSCDKGIAIKDSSYALIFNNTFFNNDTAVMCFEKNYGSGGGYADIFNSIFSTSISYDLFKDSLSSINTSYSLSDTRPLEGLTNIFDNPLFSDQSIYNFELDINSPCIGGGDPNFSSINNYNNIGSHEIYNIQDYPYDIPGIDIKIFRINEFLANNENINNDEFGEFDDWIELYYHLSDTINLSNYTITDNFDDPLKWSLPDTNIIGEGFLLLWADNNTEQGNYHTNFKLSSSGEEIALYDNNLNIIDQIVYEEQNIDISYGREKDGYYFWEYFNNPSPGTTNNIDTYTGDINNDGDINITDVVLIVNMIIGVIQIDQNADINSDGIVNIIDILQVVNSIISNISDDATHAIISKKDNILDISSDGYIGVIQIRLRHEENFDINLTEDAFLSKYKSNKNKTNILVIGPYSDKIFSANQPFQIEEILITNSQELIEIIHTSNFKLYDAYPNPFNSKTNIEFILTSDSKVSLSVYDISGRVVETIIDTEYKTGFHRVSWDAQKHASGIYLFQLNTKNYTESKKVILLK